MRDTTEPSAGINAWPKRIEAITLFAEDLERTIAFYQEVFGLPIHFETPNSAVFMFGETMINLLRITEADELVAPAEAAKPDAGVRYVLTIAVDDVDAKCAELASRGVELLNGPMDRPWGIRTASFFDPAGNIWEIAH